RAATLVANQHLAAGALLHPAGLQRRPTGRELRRAQTRALTVADHARRAATLVADQHLAAGALLRPAGVQGRPTGGELRRAQTHALTAADHARRAATLVADEHPAAGTCTRRRTAEIGRLEFLMKRHRSRGGFVESLPP